MGLLDKIKQDAKKSGQSKGSFIFFREGEKRRIRFLCDMEDGIEVTFHDNYKAGINVPCQEIFGRSCQYCDEEEMRTRSQYAWSVWDYDNSEVKIFMFPMNNCSPLGNIAAMYETYGTLLDRDYVISVQGKQKDKTYSVVPMDKNKFRNEKAKPFSKQAFLKLLDKAYPDEYADYSKDNDDDKDDDNGTDYSEMSVKELYKLCEDRGIEAEPKMKQKYYIDLLEEYDENGGLPWNTPDDNSNEDEWDEEEETSKYDGKSAKELYKLCQERNIEAMPKKTEKYYINLLEEDDKAHEDWDEEDDSDEDDEWD